MFKDSVSLVINGDKSTSAIVDSSRDFRLIMEKCRTMRGSCKQMLWGGTWTELPERANPLEHVTVKRV